MKLFKILSEINKHANVSEGYSDESEKEYILFINDKPAAKYNNIKDARNDLYLIRIKLPSTKLDIKQKVSNMVAVPDGLIESLLHGNVSLDEFLISN